MSEIKTQPIAARHIQNWDDFRDPERPAIGKVPGSFRLTDPDSDGEQWFYYCCPCGCGRTAPLMVGNGFKPQADYPTWNWNGSLDKPTLQPSVHHVGHWHGWLRNGVWESC
jgi:hypothetical protein